MIRVTVNLLASFREKRFKEELQELPRGTTLRTVTAGIGIPEKEIGMVLVNGRRAMLDDSLNDGDILYLAPWISGG